MWSTLQCAVQGKGHFKNGTPCQDKTYILQNIDCCVIALADGAGSASLSQYGAQAVVESVAKYISIEFDRLFQNENGVNVKEGLMSIIRQNLGLQAQIHNCEISSLASTLLVVAVKNNKYIIVHIGDGVIGYLKDDTLKVASYPENGEFANETYFTTSATVLQHMKLMKGMLGSIKGFVIMSDGSEASFYNKHERSLSSGIRKMMKLSLILQKKIFEDKVRETFMEVLRQRTVDDCSLAFMIIEQQKFKGFRMLTDFEKCEMLGIKIKGSDIKKRIKRYSLLLELLIKPASIIEISRALHLKEKYTKRLLGKLIDVNLIVKTGYQYKTMVSLDAKN